MPQQPVVRLVTPADENDKKYKSRDAFEKELDRLLKKKPRIQAGYKAYYGGYDPGGLEDAAAMAVEDAQAAIDAGQLAAIVTAGQIATETVQDATMNNDPPSTQIPIIQAAGGSPPPNRQKYVTGFTLNELGVAQYHLQHLDSQEVTILYDPNNSDVFNELVEDTYGKEVTGLQASTPDELDNLDPDDLTGGFMLIPNAMFYNYCNRVAKYVDGKKVDKKLVAIYYPEIEYMQEHQVDISTVTVAGHDIQGTYRQAAAYVNNILRTVWTVDTLPDFHEAIYSAPILGKGRKIKRRKGSVKLRNSKRK